MKKLRFLPLFALLLLCLCTTAFAASVPGQQQIAAIKDASGLVTQLTDDDTSTAWTKSASGDDVDLTISLYSGSVGEIWVRSGYAYTQNWYNHYSRPDVVKVTVYYRANQYTTTYDSFRYRLTDAYKPNTISEGWNSGYQRLLLPKKYTGVTKIELTIESSITGYGNTGATISDIIIAAGSHATATPQAYSTATPKPYVVYVTATPGPATAVPEEPDEPLVELITPKPTATAAAEVIKPEATNTPVVELITPRPTSTPEPKPTDVPTPAPTRVPVDYPTKSGTPATLLKRIATRTGPSNNFDEPGSFFSAGDEVNVITKAWDSENGIWWFQVEFEYSDVWYRAYTPASRIDLSPDLVPTETTEPFSTLIGTETWVYFGPGTEYKKFGWSVAYEGYAVKVYNIEGDWAQIEYYDYATEANRRGWVLLERLKDQPY